jgi:hypothetical protein
MARKKHNVGDLILSRNFNTPSIDETPLLVFGIIRKYEKNSYYVDWADGLENGEAYSWAEIQHWKELLQQYVNKSG